jgi:hypothetical protein
VRRELSRPDRVGGEQAVRQRRVSDRLGEDDHDVVRLIESRGVLQLRVRRTQREQPGEPRSPPSRPPRTPPARIRGKPRWSPSRPSPPAASSLQEKASQ